MPLSENLVKEFAELVNDKEPVETEKTLYGTIAIFKESDEDVPYVQLDGADEGTYTPIDTTVDVSDGDKVTVSIKRHSAVVTGNLTDPSAKRSVVGEMGGKYSLIEQTIDGIRHDVYDEGGKYSSITQRVDSIEVSIGNINKDYSGLQDSVGGLEGSVSGLTADYTTLTTNLGKIEGRVGDVEGNYSQLLHTINVFETTVSNIEGQYSQLTQTVEGFTFTTNEGTTKIKGYSIETGSLNLTGAITWGDLATDAQNEVNIAKNNASTALSTADEAYTKSFNATSIANAADATARDALSNANSAVYIAEAAKNIANNLSLPDYLKSTYIDETTIMSPTIFGGVFYAVDADNSFMSMQSDGVRIYAGDVEEPKIQLINKRYTTELILGAGQDYGSSNRLYFVKGDNYAQIFFEGSTGESCGFQFNSNGTMTLIGEWT